MWINLKYLCICHVETIQISPHLSYGEIWNFSPSTMWRKFRFLHMTDVGKSEMSPRLSCVWFLQYAIFAIYAVLSRNLFCRDFRVFAWRKIEPKIVSVEEKWQIWGMAMPLVDDSKTFWSTTFIHGIDSSWAMPYILNGWPMRGWWRVGAINVALAVSVAGEMGHTRGGRLRGTRAPFTESLNLAFIDSVKPGFSAKIFPF